ncbi:hypothetical protein GGI05_007198, partial [Coemansia sp. RSA 2603]
AAVVASAGTNAPGSAGPGTQTGSAATANIWGGMELGAGQQTPAALLRDNNLLSHGTSGPLTPGSLNIASGQLGVDDMNYRIRGLRIGDDSNRNIRSAELPVNMAILSRNINRHSCSHNRIIYKQVSNTSDCMMAVFSYNLSYVFMEARLLE